jgi:hypothetical protein
MLMALVPSIVGMPYVTILPAFAADDLGQGGAGFGVMVGFSAAGGVAASLVIASLTQSSRIQLLTALAALIWGTGLIALGLASEAIGYPGALASMVVIGFASMGYMTLNNTTLMTSAPPEYHGRVMSLYMLTFGVFPLMGGPLGVLADAIGGATTFVLLGLLLIAFIAMVAAVRPRDVFGRARAAAAVRHDQDAEAVSAAG